MNFMNVIFTAQKQVRQYEYKDLFSVQFRKIQIVPNFLSGLTFWDFNLKSVDECIVLKFNMNSYILRVVLVIIMEFHWFIRRIL